MLGDDDDNFEEKRFKVDVSRRIEMGRDYLDESQANIVDKDREENICAEDEEDK